MATSNGVTTTSHEKSNSETPSDTQSRKRPHHDDDDGENTNSRPNLRHGRSKRYEHSGNVAKRVKTRQFPSQKPTSQTESHDSDTLQPRNKKNRHDRKGNPSSRIHSLRKLVAKGHLPPRIQQEKERELAALLLDQQKKVTKQAARKNLQRYHFVRFMERQKADRILKQLLKRQANTEDDNEKVDKLVHEAEVDLNYTLYAPLGSKYASIFAQKKSKTRKPDMEEEGEEESILGENAGTSGKRKPPMWYKVEAAMKEGQAALDKLRDEVTRDGKAPSIGTSQLESKEKKKEGWEEAATADTIIDSKPEHDIPHSHPEHRSEDEDDEMSDGDGGFFEKR